MFLNVKAVIETGHDFIPQFYRFMILSNSLHRFCLGPWLFKCRLVNVWPRF